MDKVEIKKFAVMAREMSKEESNDIPNFEEYINHLADKRDFEFFLKERDKIVKYVESLKSQLKESEEKCHKQWLEIQAETHQIQMLEQDKERIKKNWQISKTHQQKLYNNLKQQNKAKGIVSYPITLDGCRIANEEQLLDFAKDFCLEKKYWQEQLKLAKWGESFEQEKKNNALKSQTQIAIAELEEVKKKFGYKHNSQLMVSSKGLCDFIDQQIKSLKGDK